jgi:hypothetical protein
MKIRFLRRPPEFIWGLRREPEPVSGPTPDLGQAWCTGFHGTPPDDLRHLIEQSGEGMMAAINRHLQDLVDEAASVHLGSPTNAALQAARRRG